uniref:Uncharacterized protein n=1 Tax=Setaria viridis TaxID=4556 RepID=A0A4U6UWZ0_SETVI|nr:hypothetical protein SEVIR_4G176601v2 [Setaria viridis]
MVRLHLAMAGHGCSQGNARQRQDLSASAERAHVARSKACKSKCYEAGTEPNTMMHPIIASCTLTYEDITMMDTHKLSSSPSYKSSPT